MKYSINFAGIGFTCKKSGSSSVDLQTQIGASTKEVIRGHYGTKVARELTEVAGKMEQLDAEYTGWVTNFNYSVKKTVFILFINNRLVDHPPIKRALESMFAEFLPKTGHPWIYLNLQIKPQNIDVNVHPTKMEVQFLHEDLIVDAIAEGIREKLSKHTESRSFYAQPTLSKDLRLEAIEPDKPAVDLSKVGKPAKPAYRPNKMVRTDDRLQAGSLDRFMLRPKKKASGFNMYPGRAG